MFKVQLLRYHLKQTVYKNYIFSRVGSWKIKKDINISYVVFDTTTVQLWV